MSQLSDLKMAVNATFSSILNEIQLSNLNFTIQMTPYAAYITLKKSSLKYQDGSYALPSPPVLSLLQEALRVNEIQKSEIIELKSSCAALTSDIENIVIENASVMDKLDKSKKVVIASEIRNNALRDKVETMEKELYKAYSENKLLETKVKDLKKKHMNEVNDLKNEIKSTEKANKSKEKENYNQKKVLESARDTLKNLKLKISNVNVCKTKLETENRKLKKQLEKKDHLGKFNETTKVVQQITPNSVSPLLNASASVPISFSSTQMLSSFPSMLSHWNPPCAVTPQRPASTPSMIAHCAKHPNPGSVLLSFEEVIQMMRELMKKPLFGSRDEDDR